MKRDWITPLLFLAPALILLVVFLVGPMLASLVISTTNFNIFALADWRNAHFIGLGNYAKLLQDDLFWIALKNTVLFVLAGVPLVTILSMAAALLMNLPLTRLKNLFRVGYYLPSITNAVAVAIVWRWVLNPRYGLVNWTLGLAGIHGPSWLGDIPWAMISILMLVIWKGLGYNAIIFLAGLQGIPQHYYEAAQIDGANRWQQVRYITLPLLGPTTFFVMVMAFIGYLQLFDEPYMLTSGGPLNSTLSIVLYMYRQGFRFFNLGYASAMAWVLFLLIFVVTLIQMKYRDKEIAY